MTTQHITINRLVKSPLNARRTVSSDGIDELKASILAHGLMQNLVVTETDGSRYHVIAGSRRLEALQSLVEEGTLPDDHKVQCQVVAKEHSLELSIAENIVRHAMHPADEFEAFAALIDQGENAEQIARRFGVDERHVLKRLKLGRVAPELLAAYRAEEISLESLMAFTVTGDQAKQLAVYKSLSGWQQDNAYHIRRCLTEQLLTADNRLARFVGLDAYANAGGTTRTDLFGEQVYLENPELIRSMAAEKLDTVTKGLYTEGWAWVEVSEDRDYSFTASMSRLQATVADVPPELQEQLRQAQADLEAVREQITAADEEDGGYDDNFWEKENESEQQLLGIEERLEAHASFDPEQMKFAGCYVALNHQGELTVEKGLVRKEDRKQIGGDAEPSTLKKEKPLYSNTLKEDLQTYRLQVAKLAIAQNRDVALDVLVFNVVKAEFDIHMYRGPDVRFTTNYGSVRANRDESEAMTALGSLAEKLPLDWLKHEDEAEQFAQLRLLDQSQKLDILAYYTARSLRPQLGPIGTVQESNAYEDAFGLTGVEVAAFWRPTKDNYLSRIGKDQLIAIGREIFGEKWAKIRGKWKKADLVSRLDADFSDSEDVTDRYEKLAEIYPAETVEKLKTWLPEGMAFKAAEVVVELPKRGRKKKKTA